MCKGTFLVHDAWSSTSSAAQRLALKSAPPVVHEYGYQDGKIGFHTSDVESENACHQLRNRQHYEKFSIVPKRWAKAVLYVNLGGGIENVMCWLAMANGGVMKHALP